MHSGNRRRRRAKSWSFEQLEPRQLMAVVINEFLAVNTSGLQDQDGDRSDWIELKNTDVVPINVAGWHLTDDDQDLDKWTLPSASIPAGGYLLVYASGKDRAAAGQELHTNFSLEQMGEYLALVMPDGTTVADSFAPFPAQVANISYGQGSGGTVTDGLIGEFGAVRVHVPNGATAIDSTWYTLSFVDSGWIAGTSGVGYDNDSDSTNLDPYVSVNLTAQMDMLRNTAYIRMPFQVADPAVLTTLKLKIRYEDGFGLYLNGTRITSAERSAAASLAWNSLATSTRSPQSAAATLVEIDLTASKNLLLAGSNVLAIHGLNRSTASRDFLIDAQLAADRTLSGQLGFMATPSPNAANQQGTLGVVADTNFSVDRGFYTSPFTVEITSATADAVIRYTTDGSPPTATMGTVYNPASPPLISTTTTLRAAAFKTGWTSTNVDTQTYIFLADVLQQDGVGLPAHANWGYVGPDWVVDPDVVNNPLYSGTITNDLKAVPTVSLVMPWNDWFGGAGVGIYPTQSELERAVSMEFFTADGVEEFQIDGGVEVQGGTSDDRWKQDKLSLRVKFKEPYGPEKLDFDLFHSGVLDEGAAKEFNTLNLDAQSNFVWGYGGGSDPTTQRGKAKYIQDQFAADLQNLSGGHAFHGRWVHLYINGLYWGLYNAHERPDEHFAESYYGGNDEDYDVIKHTATTVVAGETTALANYDAMLNLARQDVTVPANYAAVQATVDIDDLITYMVINYYAGNDDWPHHNWYATYNRVDPGGKWRFHSWDAEHTLKVLTYNAIQTGGYLGTPEEIHLLLIANDEYRLRFADLVHKHFYNNGLMKPANAAALYQMRMAEIDEAIVGESARWGDSHTTAAEAPGAGGAYTKAHWLATQNDLMVNYFPTRTSEVQGQFLARGWNVPLGAPLLSQFGGEVMAGYGLTLSKPGGSPVAATIYYTLDGSDPRNPATNAPSATAIPYSGQITINAGTRVQARIFFDAPLNSTVNEWSPVSDATFLLQTPFPLRIVELNYNPASYPGISDNQSMEFFELLNTGSQTISLDGVQITEFASTPYTFPNGLMLAAGQRIIVANTIASFQTAYGSGHNVSPLAYATANLSNGGERVKLLGPVGETLQDFTYSDTGGWPTTPDGGGKSLEIIDPLGDPSAPANWRASYYKGGSPGAAGLAPAVAGDSDGDADVDGADFLAWQRGLGTAALRGDASQGDADGDRDVDAADLGLWTTNYGTAPMIAAAATAGTTASSIAAAPLAADEWILSEATPRRSVRPPARARLIDAALSGSGSAARDPRFLPLDRSDAADAAEAIDAALASDVPASLASDLALRWQGVRNAE